MARRKKLIFIIGFLAVATLLLLGFCSNRRANGATYAGHSLSTWVTLLNKESDRNLESEAMRSPARKAIMHIGTNAIPFLLQWIQYEPAAPKFGMLLAQAVQHIPGGPRISYLTRPVTRPEEIARAEGATKAFRLLGNAASFAIPKLASLVDGNKSGDVTDRATQALAAIGPVALPAIIQLFNQKTDMVSRLYIVFAVGRLGTNAEYVLHEWSADPNTTISSTANDILHQIQGTTASPKIVASPQSPFH